MWERFWLCLERMS